MQLFDCRRARRICALTALLVFSSSTAMADVTITQVFRGTSGSRGGQTTGESSSAPTFASSFNLDAPPLLINGSVSGELYTSGRGFYGSAGASARAEYGRNDVEVAGEALAHSGVTFEVTGSPAYYRLAGSNWASGGGQGSFSLSGPQFWEGAGGLGEGVFKGGSINPGTYTVGASAGAYFDPGYRNMHDGSGSAFGDFSISADPFGSSQDAPWTPDRRYSGGGYGYFDDYEEDGELPDAAWFLTPESGLEYSGRFNGILGFPTGGAAAYEISVQGQSLGIFQAGQSVDFVALLGGPVSAFRVTPTAGDSNAPLVLKLSLDDLDGFSAQSNRYWTAPSATAAFADAGSWDTGTTPTATGAVTFAKASTYSVNFTADAQSGDARVSRGDVTLNLGGHIYSTPELVVNEGAAVTIKNGQLKTYDSELRGSATVAAAGQWTNERYFEVYGNLIVQPGGRVSSLNRGIYLDDDATLRLEGGTIDADISSWGTLTGNGTINGTVFVGGTLSPGFSPGLITVNGDFEQGSSSTFVMEVAGTSAGLYDVINVSGNMSLLGKLELDFINGFAPDAGDDFQLFAVGGTQSGSFSSITISGLLPGFEYELITTGGVTSLHALNDGQSVPEPSSAALLALGSVALLRRKSRGV